MKAIKLILVIVLFGSRLLSQNTKECNVYPSNLEENMWFNGYDASKHLIKGVHFMVLSDGENSKDITPAFTVKLYLYQKEAEPIYIKTFELEGLYHMGSKEYKNINVSLADIEIPNGTYRLGVHVNADQSFKEDASDNAMLFKGDVVINKE
jgi:hypothetical protein